MSVTVGTLLVELRAKTDAFMKGMGDARKYSFDSASGIASSIASIGQAFDKLKFDSGANIAKSMKTIGGVVAGVGVGMVAAMTAAGTVMVKTAVESADKFNKLSQSTGVAVETLTGFNYVAKLSGVDTESMAKGLEKASKAAYAAAGGTGDAAKAFKTLGVSVTDSGGRLRPVEDIVLDVAEKFEGMRDGAAKTALSMAIFGKAGAALIPMLNQGRTGIAGLLAEAKRLGVVLDKEAAAGAERFHDNLERLEVRMQGLGMQLMSRLLPSLESFSNELASAAQQDDFKAMIDDIATAMKYLVVATDSAITGLRLLKASTPTINSGDAATWNPVTNPFGMLKDLLKHSPEEEAKVDALLADFEKRRDALLNPTKTLSFGNGLIGPPLPPGFGKTNPTIPNEDATKKIADNVNKTIELLDQLSEKTRNLLNKSADDPLATEISNISEQLKKLLEFQNQHPESIWVSVNEQVNKLNDAMAQLQEKQKGIIATALAASANENVKSLVGVPTPLPQASGATQTAAENMRNQSDPEAMNRFRKEVYDISTALNPLRQYNAEMARLNAMEKTGELDATAHWSMATDALDRYNRSMDELDMKTKKASAGARVFFRQYIEEARNMATQAYQAMQRVTLGMENAFSSFFHDTIMQTKTLGKAFADLGVGIVDSIVSAISQMIAQMLIAFVMAKILHLDPEKQKKQQKQTNMELALSAAALAGANTLAYTSALYPPPTPEILAGVAYGTGAGFAMLASAAGGMDVDRDQILKVHEKEVVMPRVLSDGFRRIINSFNSSMPNAMPAMAGGGTMGGHTFHFNISGGNSEEVANLTMQKVKKYFRTGGVMR